MTAWSGYEMALVLTAVAAVITSAFTGVATLISAWRTEKKVDGLLDARILAAAAQGNLAGRHDLRVEQASRAASDKALVHFDAEADAASAAHIRESDASYPPKNV